MIRTPIAAPGFKINQDLIYLSNEGKLPSQSLARCLGLLAKKKSGSWVCLVATRPLGKNTAEFSQQTLLSTIWLFCYTNEGVVMFNFGDGG